MKRIATLACLAAMATILGAGSASAGVPDSAHGTTVAANSTTSGRDCIACWE